MRKIILATLFICCINSSLSAQAIGVVSKETSSKQDTNYINIFPDYISVRFYFSRKFTDMKLEDLDNSIILDYQPNTTLNFGIGATAKGFTLNLAYGFGVLNKDVGKGNTRYLDLQSHVYTRKYVIDFFGQFYNGFYLNNTKDLNPESEVPFYLRPDIRLRLFGGSFQKVFNERKFSYAAPFVQNEYQKKSAGSFLLGGVTSIIYATADSSFIPSFLNGSLFQEFEGISLLSSFQFGPSAGYAYSLIIRKHFFITASANLSLLIASTSYELDKGEVIQQWQFDPYFSSRFAIGYNSRKWYLGAQFVQNSTSVKSVDETIAGAFGVGNVRINYVKRFLMGPKLRRQVDRLPFD